MIFSTILCGKKTKNLTVKPKDASRKDQHAKWELVPEEAWEILKEQDQEEDQELANQEKT